MRTAAAVLLFALGASSAFAESTLSLRFSPIPQEPSRPDTLQNRALEDMLSQYKQSPDATDLPYDSWTFDVHRYLGYTILAATVTQAILGFMTWEARQEGEEPGTKTAHKYLGYTTAGLSLAQTSIGYVNFWKLREKQSGNTKRLVHLGLSTLATAGFVTAAAIAYDARQDIEDGTAAQEGQTFDDLYSSHRTAGIISSASVLLTVIVVVW